MRLSVIIMIMFLSLGANAQVRVNHMRVLTPAEVTMHNDGTDAFAVEGLSARMAAAENARTMRRSSTLKAVAPMVTTLWGQDSPFNGLCPLAGGGFFASPGQTGCVATAMAQVMKFFNYPASSTGVGGYSNDGSNYRTVKMNTSFKWSQMLDRYNMGYTDTQSRAVAELMRDCGYASRMVYYANGSGTTAYEAGYGICHNMQYDSLSIRVCNRMFFRDEEWRALVYSELMAGRPLMFDAVDASQNMGHAFVIDGMNENGQVHVNWGWTGDANGYYDLDNLSPSYLNPYTGQMITHHFNDEQKMIIGFKPQALPDADEEYQSFFAMQERDSIWIDNDSVKLKETPLFNFSHLTFSGLIGIVVEGMDGHAVIQPFFYSRWENNRRLETLNGVMPTPAFYPQGTLCEADQRTPRPDGKYLLYLVTWSDEEMSNGLNPRYVQFPVKYAAEGENNYGVWEANIVNGHWDASSIKRHCEAASDGIVAVRTGSPDTNVTYNLAGQRVSPDTKGLVIVNGRKILK